VETCLAKPLTSDSRTFRLQYSGFQAARHNIHVFVCFFLWVILEKLSVVELHAWRQMKRKDMTDKLETNFDGRGVALTTEELLE
jgi:hypothetical protein